MDQEEIKEALGADSTMSFEEVVADRLRLINENLSLKTESKFKVLGWKEAKEIMDKEEIYLMKPGTYEWQGEGCYTAYRNFTNPNGCEMAEHENPARAVFDLYAKLKNTKYVKLLDDAIRALQFYADPNGIWAQRVCDHGDTPTIDAENYPGEYNSPGLNARESITLIQKELDK